MICKLPECNNQISEHRLKYRALFCSDHCRCKHNRRKQEYLQCINSACRAWFSRLHGSTETKCRSCRPRKKPKPVPKEKSKQYNYGTSSAPGKSWNDHRTTHCKRETHVKGNWINCGDYCKCSDLDFKEWKKKALGGCEFKEPRQVPVNTLGSSLARCQSRSYGIT